MGDLFKSNRNRGILFLGAMMLAFLSMGSLYFVKSLEKTTSLRKKAFHVTSILNDLSLDLTLLLDSINRNQDENQTKLKEKVSSELKLLVNNLDEDKEAYKESLQLSGEWASMATGPILLPSEIKSLLDRIKNLDTVEELKINMHSPIIDKNFKVLFFGSILFIFVSIFLVIYGMREVQRDASDRNLLLEELGESEKKALAASNLKSQFMATISHELRTPLNGIIGMTDVILKQTKEAPTRKGLEMVRNSGATLLEIVEDILDFSKFESGKIDISTQIFKLSDVLSQVETSLLDRAQKKSLSLTVEVAHGLPETLEGDSSRLVQVLHNLVGNSIKFTSKGNVSILVSQDQEKTKNLLFLIEDTGIGMTSEQLEKLFQPFVQFQKHGTSGEPGTGLGLVISRHLVKAMGGDLKVESKIGFGTKFSFSIPLISNSQFTQSQKPPELSALPESSSDLKILVAEDNLTNQVVIESMLNILGYPFKIVRNGEEAIQEALSNSFNLILMDCQMPIKDGFEAVREIRSHGFLLPIIAMTASATQENKTMCLKSGMNGIITKPFRMDELNATILNYSQQEPLFFSRRIYLELKNQIGASSMESVVSAFLSTLDDFEKSAHVLDNQELPLDQLNRLGHKLKSSSKTLGFLEFSKSCETLEESKRTEETRELTQHLIRDLPKLRSRLLDELKGENYSHT